MMGLGGERPLRSQQHRCAKGRPAQGTSARGASGCLTHAWAQLLLSRPPGLARPGAEPSRNRLRAEQEHSQTQPRAGLQPLPSLKEENVPSLPLSLCPTPADLRSWPRGPSPLHFLPHGFRVLRASQPDLGSGFTPHKDHVGGGLTGTPASPRRQGRQASSPAPTGLVGLGHGGRGAGGGHRKAGVLALASAVTGETPASTSPADPLLQNWAVPGAGLGLLTGDLGCGGAESGQA